MATDNSAKIIKMEDDNFGTVEFEELVPKLDREKKKIFVIDDDESILTIARESLKDRFDVVTLINPSDVVAQAIAENPYVILLDLHMPNIDGFEALRMLKSHPFTYDVPVICMSSNGHSETREQVSQLGAVGMIKKPINAKTMSNDIAALASSLNTSISSKNELVSVHMFYSGREKENVIKDVIKESVERGEKVILMSWLLDKMFEEELLKDLIEKEDLILFFMKNSLSMRLPYLQDLSVVYADLEGFIGSEHNGCHLIIDEIKPFFLTSRKEEVFNKLVRLMEHFKNSFERVSVFNTRSNKREVTDLIHEFVREFIGII